MGFTSTFQLTFVWIKADFSHRLSVPVLLLYLIRLIAFTDYIDCVWVLLIHTPLVGVFKYIYIYIHLFIWSPKRILREFCRYCASQL